jgi:hypothetical protein
MTHKPRKIQKYGWVPDLPDAQKFISGYKVKDNKFYFQLQKMMLWGTEYDK